MVIEPDCQAWQYIMSLPARPRRSNSALSPNLGYTTHHSSGQPGGPCCRVLSSRMPGGPDQAKCYSTTTLLAASPSTCH